MNEPHEWGGDRRVHQSAAGDGQGRARGRPPPQPQPDAAVALHRRAARAGPTSPGPPTSRPPRPRTSSAGLLEEGLVEEVGRREVRGVGKPATLVGIVPDARHILTLDLSADDDIHGAVVNLIGKVLHRRTVPREQRTGGTRSPSPSASPASSWTPPTGPILGVGVGSPGIVDPSGVVVEAANLGWHDLPLARELSAAPGPPGPRRQRRQCRHAWPSTRSATRRPTTSCS